MEPKVIDVYVSTVRCKTHGALIATLCDHGYRLGAEPDSRP